LKIKLIVFGKIKTPGLMASADYYLKLIKSFSDPEIIELKPLSVKSQADIKNQEGKLLLKTIEKVAPPSRTLILMDERGKNLPTLSWVAAIEKAQLEARVPLVFCVGASLDFSDELRLKSNAVWSLGAQTLSHELARVVLFEQIYRSLSVIHRHPYHNN
jgi:23S rRNA (pseudouridine1915-N3)-methyltransferase